MKLGDVARNPLGIIGLFISLIYGFANWMLGSTANTLVSCERIIIIWFIVLFPVLILGAFCYLVVNHHGKLYAPKDYNKDESFLQTLNPFDSFVRLTTETFGSNQERPGETPQASNDLQVKDDQNAEIASGVEGNANPADAPVLQADDTAPCPATEQAVDPINKVAEESDVSTIVAASDTENDLDLIEHAKKQKQLFQMKEVFELTQHFISSDERFSGVDVKLNVKMGGTGVVYDAAAYTESGLQCLEVKYLRSVSSFKNLLVKYINQARIVKAAVSPADFNLKLVIVYDWDLHIGQQLRAILKSVGPMLQDFVKVELVPRSSVSV
ncbi:hypothetical protein [Pseudomonas sp. JV241A]|uniref:hypothetical protein n=1 Tax=Pseudomonas sp. JV241A TaxID=2078785 RepID=UPI00100D8B98|nr:hypothetical protein [Pseudomonas sp. JV241A]SPO69505.1 protein of unknown function [Pseudomonas sp. JV241A]